MTKAEMCLYRLAKKKTVFFVKCCIFIYFIFFNSFLYSLNFEKKKFNKKQTKKMKKLKQ